MKEKMIDNSVRTFGIDARGAGDKFHSARPKSLLPVVILCLTSPNGQSSIDKLHDGMIADVTRLVQRLNIPGADQLHFCVTGMNAEIRKFLTPRQEAWLVDGVYVQVAFRVPRVINDDYCGDALAHSMTLYDLHVDATGSLDPGTHGDVRIIINDPTVDKNAVLNKMEEIAESIRRRIGDYFRHGIGIWTKDLVATRNEIAVKVRTLLANGDPNVEYAKFVRSGAIYFLESVSN